MQPKKVLLLEDDAVYFNIWKSIFEKAAIEADIHFFKTTQAAEDAIYHTLKEGRPFDLLILDIFVEGTVSGLTLWQKYERYFEYETILVSATEPDRVYRYLGERGDYPFYFKKPLKVGDCEKTLKWIFKYQDDLRKRNIHSSSLI